MRLSRRQVAVKVLEAVPEFGVLHVVEKVHACFEILDEYGLFGEEGFGGELLELFVLDPLEQQVLFHVGEQVVEIVRQVVPEEFLEEERFNPREDIDAALLAVEGLELLVVARLVPLLFHGQGVLIN